MKKNKIIIIAGPTGVGKTDISISVAQKLDGEIISADSMQIYRGMDIGTAKITRQEMKGIVHHLIDIVSPVVKFTAYDFKELSTKAINDIAARGKVPIIVGGTGLYINTLLYDMDFNNANVDEEYRTELKTKCEQYGEDHLYRMLLEIDPDTKIEKENVKRVIRALEIYRATGSIRDFDKMMPREDIDAELFVLNRERAALYDNINRRVDKMIESGLIDEVQSLYDNGIDERYQSMKAIGYYQILQYFQGVWTKEQAIDRIKQESRRYAKRQITWFKRYKTAQWFDITNSSEEEAIDKIK